MTEAELLPLLGGHTEGLHVRIVEVCDSTNSALKRDAASLPADSVLIALTQTGGRGRLGRSFYSPPGHGLYISLLLRPALSQDDLTLLTPAAAVAVCRAVEGLFGVRARIKWVNDVYVREKKACGILTEAVFAPDGGLSHVVLGLGVNLTPPPGGFPAEISEIAGAVLTEDRPGALPALAAAVLTEFYSLYRALPARAFAQEYASRLLYVGRDVRIIRSETAAPARVLGADDRCRLLVRYPDGTEEALSGGEITLRPAGGKL